MQFKEIKGTEINYDLVTLARCKIYIQDYLLSEANLKASMRLICDYLADADEAFSSDLVCQAIRDLYKDGYLDIAEKPIHALVNQSFLLVKWYGTKKLPPFQDTLFNPDLTLAEFGPNIRPGFEDWTSDFKMPDAEKNTNWIEHEGIFKKVIIAPSIPGFSQFGRTLDTLKPDHLSDLQELLNHRGSDVGGFKLLSGREIPLAPEGFCWYAIGHGIKLIRASTTQSLQMKIEQEIHFRDSHARRIGKSQVQDIE